MHETVGWQQGQCSFRLTLSSTEQLCSILPLAFLVGSRDPWRRWIGSPHQVDSGVAVPFRIFLFIKRVTLWLDWQLLKGAKEGRILILASRLLEDATSHGRTSSSHPLPSSRPIVRMPAQRHSALTHAQRVRARKNSSVTEPCATIRTGQGSTGPWIRTRKNASASPTSIVHLVSLQPRALGHFAPCFTETHVFDRHLPDNAFVVQVCEFELCPSSRKRAEMDAAGMHGLA